MIAALLVCLAGQLHSGDTLEAVRFAGNRSFSSRTLASLTTAKPRRPCSEVQLNTDAATLELFYGSQGFHSAQVEKQVSRGRRLQLVTYRITEGPRTRVSAIALSGNRSVGTERLLRQLVARPGRFLTQPDVDQSAAALRAFYLNIGYPFVQVQASVTRVDTLATLAFDVSEGRLCHVREVRVRYNRTVRTSTILRASEIRAGERFSQKRLYEAQRRLYATKLFSRVVSYVIADSGQGKEDSVLVRFDVFEQASRGIALGAGVETPPNRMLFSAEWEHDNLLNLGHTLLLGGEYSPTFTRSYRLEVEGTYRVPYLVLTRIDFQTRPYLNYERTDTTLQREYGIESGMTRNLVPQFTVGLSNRLRLVSSSSGGITNSLGLSGQYDTRDNILDPSLGLSIRMVAEGAGAFLGGDNDFYRASADLRWYHGLRSRGRDAGEGKQFVLAARAMAGRIWPFGRTEAVPYYEAFTLGGRSSLRGYPDRSLGPDFTEAGKYWYGAAVVNGNIELRSPYILGWVRLVGFADAGSVGRDLRLFAYEYSAGAGIRVRTPIGPVRLDWGKRLKSPPAGDKGRFYLGLLHAF